MVKQTAAEEVAAEMAEGAAVVDAAAGTVNGEMIHADKEMTRTEVGHLFDEGEPGLPLKLANVFQRLDVVDFGVI